MAPLLKTYTPNCVIMYNNNEFMQSIRGAEFRIMTFETITKERLMSTDEKIASVQASFAMEDMILTAEELERGRMIIENKVDVEDVVREITSRYVSVG